MRCYEEDGNVYVKVPNILLQLSGDLFVYVYPYSGDEAHTSIKKKFNIRAREKPYDYVYTETELEDYKKIAEQYEANVHYEQTLQETKDILEPLVGTLPYMTVDSRGEVANIKISQVDFVLDENGNVLYIRIPFPGSLGSLLDPYGYGSMEYWKHLTFVFKMRYRRTDLTYAPYHSFQNVINCNYMSTNRIMFSLKFDETFLLLGYFSNNPDIIVNKDELYDVPCYIDCGSGGLYFYIENQHVANAIYQNAEGNEFTFTVYRSEYWFPTDIDEALDKINGEVI